MAGTWVAGENIFARDGFFSRERMLRRRTGVRLPLNERVGYCAAMRIAAYNIYEGGLGRIDPIAEVLRQIAVDVAIIPEASDRGAFEKLADRLGMDAFMAVNPRHGGSAVGLLSRLPIVYAENLGALDARITRAALRATVRGGALDFGVIGLHLHAGETLADEDVRLREWPAILEAAGYFSRKNMPHALAGDFNAHHPEQKIDIEKLRPKARARIAAQNDEIPREVVTQILGAGYVDAHAAMHRPEDFGTSLTTAFPAERVDYIFVPAGMRGAVVRCDYPRPGGADGIARFASDHFAVVAELNL